MKKNLSYSKNNLPSLIWTRCIMQFAGQLYDLYQIHFIRFCWKLITD